MSRSDLDTTFTTCYQHYLTSLLNYSKKYRPLNTAQAKELLQDFYIWMVDKQAAGKLADVENHKNYVGNSMYKYYIDTLRKSNCKKQMEMVYDYNFERLESPAPDYDYEEHVQTSIFQIVNYFSQNLTEKQFNVFLQRYIYKKTIKSINEMYRYSITSINVIIREIKDIAKKSPYKLN